jgi:hypothetical protein
MKLNLAFKGAKSIANLGNNTFVVTMDRGESVEFSLVCASALKTGTERMDEMVKAPPKALTANAKKAHNIATASESIHAEFPGTKKDPVDFLTSKSATTLSSTYISSTDFDSPQPLVQRFDPRLKDGVHDVTGLGFTQAVGMLTVGELSLDVCDERRSKQHVDQVSSLHTVKKLLCMMLVCLFSEEQGK